MVVELLVRNRFVPLPGATATRIAANAWEIHVPASPAVQRLVRNAGDPTAWDGAVFSLDGVQTEPAIGSGATRDGVKVTALV